MTSDSSHPSGRSESGKLVFSSKLASVTNNLFDITSSATACRYRFIECKAFLEDDELRLYEYEDLPSSSYAAISYVWRGNPMIDDPTDSHYWNEEVGTFVVKGAEGGDPISLSVLRHACVAALPTIQYLWLDKLCIIQTNKMDKAWQISRMYWIYKCCEVCYVLPGGIQRLASVREGTAWVYRAWTLQEALVPKRAVVIFWCHKGSMPQSSYPELWKFDGREVVPTKSGCADLRHLLEEHQVSMKNAGYSRMCRNFGEIRDSEEEAALYGALTAADDNEDLKYQAIWRSALLRTSSRPVDMVFSIMQLFGVSLDPLKFGKHDRMGATIALASQILANGGKAHWLGSLYSIPPSYQLSTFPRFPHTTVTEYVKTRDMIWRPTHWVHGLPGGCMDDEGYFNFTGEAIPVVLSEGRYSEYSGFRMTKRRKMYLHSHIAVWLVMDTTNPSELEFPRAFAVSLGRLLEYGTSGVAESRNVGKRVPRRAPSMEILLTPSSFEMEGRNDDSDSDIEVDMDILGDLEWIRELQLILVEHSPGKFHRADVVELKVNYMEYVEARRTMSFSVGGPIPISVDQEEAEKLGSIYYSKYEND